MSSGYSAIRAALGIPETATHDDAIERARRIAYEAETARLIHETGGSVRYDWNGERWYAVIDGNYQDWCDFHLAVRAAAGKEGS